MSSNNSRIHILLKLMWNIHQDKTHSEPHNTLGLNKSKGIAIIQCMLMNHNGIELEINNGKIAGKIPKY